MPTRIDPIITVTSESEAPVDAMTNHWSATVAMTGEVVHNAYLGSPNWTASTSNVNTMANPREDHCEPTMRLFTSIVTEDTHQTMCRDPDVPLGVFIHSVHGFCDRGHREVRHVDVDQRDIMLSVDEQLEGLILQRRVEDIQEEDLHGLCCG